MVEINEVAHLVNHHLADAVFVEFDELHIETDVASSRAAAPPRLHVADGDFRWCHVVFAEFLDYWRKKIAEDDFCLGFIPFVN